MRGPYRDNIYVVTSSESPDDDPMPLTATDDEGARAQVAWLVEHHGLNPSDIHIFYRVQVTAFTDWVQIGHDVTDYDRVIRRLFEEFKP